ncbi:MAG: hypothetical protein ACOYOK_02900 [Pseudobdellovibrionaceae bacterium]
MLPYNFYKVLHLIGLVSLFIGLGGIIVSQIAETQLVKKAKAVAYSAHGIGLLLMFISGFAMAGKGGFMSQGWVYSKILIWLLLALSISVIKRSTLLAMVLLLSGLAIYLVEYKPF